jgi:hypothetical protein
MSGVFFTLYPELSPIVLASVSHLNREEFAVIIVHGLEEKLSILSLWD